VILRTLIPGKPGAIKKDRRTLTFLEGSSLKHFMEHVVRLDAYHAARPRKSRCLCNTFRASSL